MKQKKILMIAYYFPPFGGVPVQRTVKFVKYLVRFGWNPLVLTVRDGYDHFHPNDPSLMNKVSDKVVVIRVREIGVISRIIQLMRRGTSPNNTLENRKKFGGVITKLRKMLYNSLWFPDEKSCWMPGAVVAALRVLSEGGISALYVSGYPWSSFLAALMVSKMKRVPLIVDFRDAWTLNQRGLWNSRLHRFWENKVLLQASRVIFATHLMQDCYARRYPWIDREKFVTITNGYDREDFKQFHGRKEKKNRRFLITLAGTFNDNVPPLETDQSPYYFLLGLASLLNKEDLSETLLVRFVGKFGENNKKFVKSLGLEKVVELTGYVSHERSIEYQMESDILLLIICQCESAGFVLTGKLFEYIGARKPILALVPDGDAKELILKENLGKAVAPADIEGIRQAVSDFYQSWKDNELKLDEDDNTFQKYEMKTLTQQLVDVIEKTRL